MPTRTSQSSAAGHGSGVGTGPGACGDGRHAITINGAVLQLLCVTPEEASHVAELLTVA
jgi:hypothetical protein